MNPIETKKSHPKRGFGSMDPARQREIASLGGKVAHRSGTAHEYTSEEARAASLKSAAARRAKREAKKAANGTPNL